ncbi:uncharacterized protein TNCV_4636311 [Trichonephila clavipes]|uniref:Uncharacterized protein n=1 Tax=Trichonephila clavipes TaxID=2585209 RepID=A0A8X6RE26_TRICX|nr:uncharacterized protein TNCV_4636311 [Trichonephila clavipes]
MVSSVPESDLLWPRHTGLAKGAMVGEKFSKIAGVVSWIREERPCPGSRELTRSPGWNRLEENPGWMELEESAKERNLVEIRVEGRKDDEHPVKVFYITLCVVGVVGVLIGGIAGGIWIHRKCCRNDESCQPEKLNVPRISISDAEKQECKSSDVNLRRASTFQDLSNVDIKIVNCEWKSTSDMIYNTPQGMLQPGLYPYHCSRRKQKPTSDINKALTGGAQRTSLNQSPGDQNRGFSTADVDSHWLGTHACAVLAISLRCQSMFRSSANKEPFSMGRIFFVIYYENQEEKLHLFIKEVAFIQVMIIYIRHRQSMAHVSHVARGAILRFILHQYELHAHRPCDLELQLSDEEDN